MVGQPERESGTDLERGIPQGGRDVQGAAAAFNGAVLLPQHPEIVRHPPRCPAESPLISEGLGEARGLPRVLEPPVGLSELGQRAAKIEAQIDGLLERAVGLREMTHGDKALLKACHGLS